MEPAGLDISREDDRLSITMPVAPNRWLVGLGIGAAVPWLVAFVLGSVLVPLLAPDGLRRTAVLGAIAVNLLFFIVHMLAVMGVWLAVYKLRGCEQVVVTSDRFALLRRAMGITVPLRLGRTTHDQVEMLDPTKTPGKAAHPRLEVRAGRSAVRFGAGLSAAEAIRVHDVLAEEFERRP